MKRILFICHGNICRSPMAEMVFKHIAASRGKGADFFVDSAATTYDAIGCPIHRGTRSALVRNGIPFTEHVARLVTADEYGSFDFIVCMDDENVRHLARIFGSDPEGKIHKLLEYCGEPRDVADPWYTGNFDEPFDDVRRGCTGLFGTISEESK